MVSQEMKLSKAISMALDEENQHLKAEIERLRPIADLALANEPPRCDGNEHKSLVDEIARLTELFDIGAHLPELRCDLLEHESDVPADWEQIIGERDQLRDENSLLAEQRRNQTGEIIRLLKQVSELKLTLAETNVSPATVKYWNIVTVEPSVSLTTPSVNMSTDRDDSDKALETDGLSNSEKTLCTDCDPECICGIPEDVLIPVVNRDSDDVTRDNFVTRGEFTWEKEQRDHDTVLLEDRIESLKAQLNLFVGRLGGIANSLNDLENRCQA
jgi:hypothetical protein